MNFKFVENSFEYSVSGLTDGHHFHQDLQLDQQCSHGCTQSGSQCRQGWCACCWPHLAQSPEQTNRIVVQRLLINRIHFQSHLHYVDVNCIVTVNIYVSIYRLFKRTVLYFILGLFLETELLFFTFYSVRRISNCFNVQSFY